MDKNLSNVKFVGRISGRYSLPTRISASGVCIFACRTQGISPRTATITGPVFADAGEPVSANFDEIGMITGHISRKVDGGFSINIDPTKNDFHKLASRIEWVKRWKSVGATDNRAHKRLIPRISNTYLIIASGELIPCFIIDMSSTGVALSADYRPPVGTLLAVGKAIGKVVRHTEVGFAFEFARAIELEKLESTLIMTTAEFKAFSRSPIII